MKLLELQLETGTVAVFCPEEVIDFVHQLSDSFIYDEEEMAFFETVYPEWAPWLLDQVKKQIAIQSQTWHQFAQKG